MEQVVRTPKQLGAAVRRARKMAGLSQVALSEKVNLRQATVSRLEAGEPVELQTLMAALAALDLELVVQPRSKGRAMDVADLF